MSLLRLLTAGRCWISAKPMGRYQFSDPRSMPKFGAGLNPFKVKVADAPSPEVETVERQGAPAAPVVEVVKVEAVEGERTSGEPDWSDRSDEPEEVKAAEQLAENSTPEIEDQEEKEAAQRIVSRPQKGPGWISRVGSLTSSLRMRLWWKPRKGAPQPQPVQGELSLDNIKPVRNDLSDTDLEVVPLRTSAIVKAKAKVRQTVTVSDVTESSPELSQGPQPQEQDLIEAGRT